MEELPACKHMVHDDAERPYIKGSARFYGALKHVYAIRLDAVDKCKLLQHAHDQLVVLTPPRCGWRPVNRAARAGQHTVCA